jgi:thiol-disulfide isomerase/thioredoxin
MRKTFWKLLIILAIFALDISKVDAANNPVPQVGKPCPDFTLDNLHNSKKPKISLRDFKGKWLIIDFWAFYCTSCVESFPKANHLQQIFKSELTYLLIGYNDFHFGHNIKSLYLKLEDKMHLQLLAAFDSVLFTRWEVPSVPHLIIVDPTGKVYAITGSDETDSTKIRELLDGKKPVFLPKTFSIKFDPEKPLLINNNGGPDTGFLYRSLLTRYVDEGIRPLEYIYNYKEKNKIGFQVTSASLDELYRYAFVGKWYWGSDQDSLSEKYSPNLELDIKDSALFNSDYSKIDNLFNYSLYVPPGKANRNYLMHVLQRELKNCFGYEVTLEDKEVPCWRLIVRKDTLVSFRSRGLSKEDSVDAMQVRIKNGSLKYLLLSIAVNHQTQTPFIDETGIDYPVDIELDALLIDLKDVQQALRRSGLDLVKGKKMMKVIVIRDPVHN